MSTQRRAAEVVTVPSSAPALLDRAHSARIETTTIEIEAAIERALDECDREAFSFEDLVTDEAAFATASSESRSHPDPAPAFDEIEESFFARGVALCQQHRAEANELLAREAARASQRWWRRLFSRSRRPAFA